MHTLQYAKFNQDLKKEKFEEPLLSNSDNDNHLLFNMNNNFSIHDWNVSNGYAYNLNAIPELDTNILSSNMLHTGHSEHFVASTYQHKSAPEHLNNNNNNNNSNYVLGPQVSNSISTALIFEDQPQESIQTFKDTSFEKEMCSFNDRLQNIISTTFQTPIKRNAQYNNVLISPPTSREEPLIDPKYYDLHISSVKPVPIVSPRKSPLSNTISRESSNVSSNKVDIPTTNEIKAFGKTKVFVPSANWKQSVLKRFTDQSCKKRKHPKDSGVLDDFPSYGCHSTDCSGCQTVSSDTILGIKDITASVKVCTLNQIDTGVFWNALKRYNTKQGPTLEMAIQCDPNWVYEYRNANNNYTPLLSRYPKYPKTYEEWIDCYRFKFQEWYKSNVFKLNSSKNDIQFDDQIWNNLYPAKDAIMDDVQKAILEAPNRSERKKVNKKEKFLFLIPQKALIGSEVEVDADEKECHCPFCPIDPINPSNNFFHRKKSAYRGHLMNTHGIFDDGSSLDPPECILPFYEYEKKSQVWKYYPAAQCPHCAIFVKITNKNHGMLGYLRHMVSHKLRK